MTSAVIDRRTFLQSATAPLILSLSKDEHAGQPPRAEARKAVLISMLPKDGSYAQRFAIARAAGFAAIEMQTVARGDEAAEIRDAAATTGLRIHSVMNADHWRFPLSSGDRETVD